MPLRTDDAARNLGGVVLLAFSEGSAVSSSDD
jgi:hypothetical protein